MHGFRIAFVSLLSAIGFAAAMAGAAEPPASASSWASHNEKLRRFYDLDDMIAAAYEQRDWAGATRLAREYLDMAGDFQSDWNYGNAIHDGNRWLGLIALENADVAAASRYLRQAGGSPGSPQLDSFGPTLDLADALLKRGETEAVKAYLRDINRFWDRAQVDEWIEQIERGERPALDRTGSSVPRWFKRIVLAGLAWPAVVVLAFLAVYRARLRRKAAFVGIGLAAAYAASAIAAAGVALLWAVIMDDVDRTMAVMPYAILAAPLILVLSPVVAVGLVRRRLTRP